MLLGTNAHAEFEGCHVLLTEEELPMFFSGPSHDVGPFSPISSQSAESTDGQGRGPGRSVRDLSEQTGGEHCQLGTPFPIDGKQG
jgi:hypothetical protein